VCYNLTVQNAYKQQLDTLRAFSVIIVMFYHWKAPLFSAGFLGVDVFFVLSGFLITTLMIKERKKKGKINFKNFWARRILRLMPLYLFFLTIFLVFSLVLQPSLDLKNNEVQIYLLSLFFYFKNYILADYGPLAYFTIHLWSLAAEEQFYFIWPFLFFVLSKLKLKTVVVFMVSVIISMQVYRIIYSYDQHAFTLHFRGIGMLLGCLFAFLNEYFEKYRLFENKKKMFSVLFVLGYLVITILKIKFDISVKVLLSFTTIPFGVISALLIVSIWNDKTNSLGWLYGNRSLQYLGKISYGLYVWHVVAQVVIWKFFSPSFNEGFMEDSFYILQSLVHFGLTIAISHVSYVYLESYFLKFKSKFR